MEGGRKRREEVVKIKTAALDHRKALPSFLQMIYPEHEARHSILMQSMFKSIFLLTYGTVVKESKSGRLLQCTLASYFTS